MCNENEWEEIDYYQPECGNRRYFSYSDQYEHKVMRRKKQEPFPVLLPGDRVLSSVSETIVTSVEGNRIAGWFAPLTGTLRYETHAISIEQVDEVQRRGNTIWRKR